jgi:hypothetical protein
MDILQPSSAARPRRTSKIGYADTEKRLEGKAFPLVGVAVADAPLLRGHPRNGPLIVRGRTGFAVTGCGLEERPPAPVMETNVLNFFRIVRNTGVPMGADRPPSVAQIHYSIQELDACKGGVPLGSRCTSPNSHALRKARNIRAAPSR